MNIFAFDILESSKLNREVPRNWPTKNQQQQGYKVQYLLVLGK